MEKRRQGRVFLTSNERIGRLERLGVKHGQAMAQPSYRREDQEAEQIPSGQKPYLPANARNHGSANEPNRIKQRKGEWRVGMRRDYA
jgi:hypothetical protein